MSDTPTSQLVPLWAPWVGEAFRCLASDCQTMDKKDDIFKEEMLFRQSAVTFSPAAACAALAGGASIETIESPSLE